MNSYLNPKISIIIPHYNNFKIIDECINSLYNMEYKDFEIIIIDNASYDNSVDLIKEKYQQLIIHTLNNNIGYAGACNKGAQLAKGDYLLFLNNDTIHTPNFIIPLLKKIESSNKIAAVQPKIKNINKKEYFDYSGASGGYIDYLVFPYCRGRIFNKIEKDVGQYDDEIKVFWTSGTSFLTRKDVFLKVFGFDNDFFAHMEEIDFCWKCYLSGYECWVVPNSIIYHHGGKTLSSSSYRKTFLNHRNSLILLLTNYSLGLSLYLIPLRIILELISSIYDLLRFRIVHFLAHYLALLYILFNIPYLYRRRKLINKIRVKKDQYIFDQQIILNQSIVKKYFLFNKNTYSKNIIK